MFSLNFREGLQLLSKVLMEELEQITASAQAKWYPQHDDLGGHGSVTATSLTTPRVTLTQSDGAAYTLYAEGGKLYIVAGTSPTGGTVVGTQT